MKLCTALIHLCVSHYNGSHFPLICICLLFFTSLSPSCSALFTYLSHPLLYLLLSPSLLWHCLLSTSPQSSILILSQLCCTHLYLPVFFFFSFGDSLYLYTPQFWLPLIPSLFLSETALSGGTQSGILQPFTKYKYTYLSLHCLLIHSGPITDNLAWGGNVQYSESHTLKCFHAYLKDQSNILEHIVCWSSQCNFLVQNVVSLV